MPKLRRVYKFLPYKYGIEALEKKHLKISEIGRLNDPFDLVPFDLSRPDLRKWFHEARIRLGKLSGILCFSKIWSCPVLWAHYAENHRGFALGFDLLPDYGSDVQYVKAPERLKFPLDEDCAGRAPYLKYDGWSYEREVRIGVLLKEPAPNGFHYNSFGDGFILKEVIVGSANPISNTSMQKLLRAHPGVSMRKVRPAYKEFMMVKDLRGLS